MNIDDEEDEDNKESSLQYSFGTWQEYVCHISQGHIEYLKSSRTFPC